MDFKPVKIALIGSGAISYTYINTLTSEFKIVDFVGCSDLIPERSKARAETFGIRQMTNDEILNDPEIEIVLNTTELRNHTKVTKMILEAGKNAYSEKALGDDYAGALANVELAKSKGLRLGSAPDIYFGASYQTARKLIDDGWIGDPVVARAWCIRHYASYESPNAQGSDSPWGAKGSTITYDMAGYYVNALVTLLGPVAKVAGYSRFYDKHTYSNPLHPDYGQPVKQLTGATTMMGCLEFESGVYGDLVLCSEGYGPEIPRVEIIGTKGMLTLSDPNNFGGCWDNFIYLNRVGNEGSYKMPFTHAYADKDPTLPTKSGKPEPCHNGHRGIAVADMAWAIRRNRPHRSSAELALHTVEIVSAIEECLGNGAIYTTLSRPARPAPLKDGLFGAAAESSLDT